MTSRGEGASTGRRGWRDAVLSVLAVQYAAVGPWALVAPRSFYDSFPGFGRVWVSVDGPYNEHLVRDVGAFFAALALVNAFAFVNRTSSAVRAAGLGTAVFSGPHLAYHLSTADLLPFGDAVVNVSSLSAGLLVGLALCVSPSRRRHDLDLAADGSALA